MIDSTLVKEIKTAIGNGSREAKFALLRRLDAASRDLSTTSVRDTFGDCLRKHGRAVTAICVAVTLDARKERLDHWGWTWAHEVLALLPQTITPGNRERGYINDGIHPTAICEYAGAFIRATNERGGL